MYLRLSWPADRFETVDKTDATTSPADRFETVDKTDAATTPYYGNITDGTSTTLDSDIITDETTNYLIPLVVCIVILLVSLVVLTLWLRRYRDGKSELWVSVDRLYSHSSHLRLYIRLI